MSNTSSPTSIHSPDGYTFDLVASDEGFSYPGDPMAHLDCSGTVSHDLAEWLRLDERDAGRRTECVMTSLTLMMRDSGWHPSLPHCREMPLRFSMIVDSNLVEVVASVTQRGGKPEIHLAIDDHTRN